MNTTYGPAAPFSEELHSQKYRSEGETFEQAMRRIAQVLSDPIDNHHDKFLDSLLSMRFMPAGRVQTAIGSTKNVTPYNCFVIPIEDSFVAGTNSIMEAATNAAATMRMGGGVGYDFSRLRPKGAWIQKLKSKSSGPVSFMEIFDAVCRCTASSGHRRGAQMGVMRVDHPDIHTFVRAKNNTGVLEGFNMSVAITDEFMECVISGKKFPLRFNNEIYGYCSAEHLWDEIMLSTWDWAEPGVIFIDQINRMNNLWYCEKLEACNPCSEQPLPPFGACLLGSFNLAKYVVPSNQEPYFLRFDFEQFIADIPVVVRAMDNIIDIAIYPLEQQREEALSKRRMGLGITGLANAGEALGLAYGSAEFVAFEKQVMAILANEAYSASAFLAVEKGSFPKFDRIKYLQGNYIASLDPKTRELIYTYGIRNSHLISVAPTGTISMCADNVSSGIEPVFDYAFQRTVIEFDGPRVETVRDYGIEHFGVRGKRCGNVTVQEHIDVLVAAQQFTDSAVSKTCNVSSGTSYEDFKHIYMDAWKRGAKGCSTFRVDGKRRGVLESKEPATCKIDPLTGRGTCD